MTKRDPERERARELLRRLGKRWDEIDVGVVVEAFRAEHAETWDEAASKLMPMYEPEEKLVQSFRRRAKRLRGSR